MFGGVVVGGRRCLLGGPSLRRQNMLRVRVNPWGQEELASNFLGRALRKSQMLMAPLLMEGWKFDQEST